MQDVLLTYIEEERSSVGQSVYQHPLGGSQCTHSVRTKTLEYSTDWPGSTWRAGTELHNAVNLKQRGEPSFQFSLSLEQELTGHIGLTGHWVSRVS